MGRGWQADKATGFGGTDNVCAGLSVHAKLVGVSIARTPGNLWVAERLAAYFSTRRDMNVVPAEDSEEG